MEKMRVCIIEDSQQDLDILKAALERFSTDSRIDIDIAAFSDGADALKEYPDSIDILFLDIEMEKLDGLSTARVIRARDDDIIILFVTHMIQFALDGYTVDAFAFIVKPLRYPLFSKHMQRAVAALDRRKSHLVTVQSGRETAFVNANRITFVETDRKRTLIHTEQENIPCSETLQALERKLDSARFFRVHASFLINMTFVDTMTSKDVIVAGTTIPVSKHRKQFFLKALTDYKGRLL